MTYASVHLAIVSNIFCSLFNVFIVRQKTITESTFIHWKCGQGPADTAAAAWWRDPTLCPELQESDTLVPAADMWAIFDKVSNEEYNTF